MNISHSLCVSIIFFSISVVIHLIITRVYSVTNFMNRGLGIGLITGLGLIIYQVKTDQIDLVSLYILGAGWLAYLMFFINLLNSATLKMLEYLATKGSVETIEFNKIFNEGESLVNRLKAMQQNNFIVIQDDLINTTEKGKSLIQKIPLLRKILSIDQVG